MSSGERPAGALTGKTLAGYRILELIGAGAMGEVYRAYHMRLRRTVAIKVLRDEEFAGYRSRQRFIREVRLASRIMHPYVTTVLDVVESEAGTLLVQEYVDGRRLDALLRERKLSAEEALRYALELCEALCAVHDAGFVHRDIKPANVMITKSGHVKLLDLGIARRIRPPALRAVEADDQTTIDPTLTEPGGQPGTVPYMSPEQARGEPPDPRSDLFALGVVLWEMLTGEHPFARASAHETVAAILTEPPGRGAVPRCFTEFPAVRVVLDRLLAKRREDRYPDARTAAAALRGALPAVTSPGTTSEGWPGTIRTRPVRWIGVSLAFLAVALAAAGAWWWREAASRAGPQRPALAVLPLADRTGEPEGDLHAAMLAGLVTADLGGLRSLRTIPHERILEILAGAADEPLAAKIERVRRETSARWVAAGTLWREGSSYFATFDVYGPSGTEAETTFRVGAGGVVGLADQAGPRILRAIVPEAAPPPPQPARPASDAAAQAAYEGAQALREMRLSRAIGRLEESVRQDPEYAEGWLLLARALDEAGFGERARRAARRAVRLLEESRDGSDPRLVRARAVAARIEQRREEELEAWRALVRDYPDDPEFHTELAEALLADGRREEALAEAERAVAIEPRSPRALLARARALALTGDPESARRDLDRAERIFRELGSPAGQAAVRIGRGHLARSEGDLAGALELYAEAADLLRDAGLEARAVQADLEAGLMALRLGRLDEARRRIDAAIGPAHRFGTYRAIVHSRASLGTYAFAAGDYGTAERELRAALETAATLENPAVALDPLINLTSLLLYLGRRAEARSRAEEALSAARSLGHKPAEMRALTLLAETELEEGHLQEGIAAEREVLRLAAGVPEARQTLGYTHSSLALALEAAGNVGEALEEIDAALALDAEHGLSEDVAATRIEKALILARYGDAESARAEIDAVEASGVAEQDPSGELSVWIAHARSVLAWSSGDLSEAERQFRVAIERSPTTLPLAGEVNRLGARLALARGRYREAEKLARAVLENPGAGALVRNDARTLLARALAAGGRMEEAQRLARLSLEEAERFGAPRLAASAAAALLEAGEVADRQVVRERGLRALRRVLDGIPEDRRAAAARQTELARVIEILERRTGRGAGEGDA
ncbi:MAG: serine/threonine-protein kinase [Acidobacteria bacterium]|nr:MAG: serine/threonine-protein kinase [Acidobacteriota bacterium]